jgi:uncharacterized membrane protein
MNELQNRAKHPASVLAGRYGHPVHPILVTIPIGAWFMSLVFDIASFAVPDPAWLYRGALWLVGAGVIMAGLAALAGLLDFSRIEPGTRAFRVGFTHMTLNLVVTGAFVVSWALRFAHRIGAGRVPPGYFVLDLIAFGVLVASGVLGGMLAYRYGVRVADEATQAQGFERAPERRPGGLHGEPPASPA